jgi:uncharacterized protein (DUF362 family)
VSLVSYVKTKRKNLKQAIEESLNLIDYKISTSNKKVIIKPNLCYYWDYSTGQTTHPKLVAALIELLQEKINPDVEISIVEADASAMKCRHSFKFLGYEKLANQYNVDLINLSETETESVKIQLAKTAFSLKLPLLVKDADLRINIPKIKYMAPTKISCALKNIFGANPNPSKYKYHSRLSETIVAVNKLMQFDLHILDGIIVAGKPTTRLDLLMASRDPVALDSAAARLVNMNPKTIKHINLAQKEGLGNLTFVSKGINPKFFQRRYPKMKPTTKVLNLAYRLATQTGLLQI